MIAIKIIARHHQNLLKYTWSVKEFALQGELMYPQAFSN